MCVHMCVQTPTEVSSIHPDLRSFAFTKLDGAMCGYVAL